jgi:hypothetical protein
VAGDKAAARAVLAEAGFQITANGQAIPLDRVDPSQLWNFYHVAQLLVAYTGHRHKAERVLNALDHPAGRIEGPELLALEAVRRCGKVDGIALFGRVKSAAEAPVAHLDDSELQGILQDVMACYGTAFAFQDIALRGIGFLSQRVVAAFDELQGRAKSLFVALRPVLQELMGRPTDPQIDAAITQVETAQETLDGLMEDFRLYVDGLMVAEEHCPDPTQPMDASGNDARIKYVRRQLQVVLGDDGVTCESLVQAMERAAGMIRTVVTAIQQIDQRLAGFGVTAAS